MFGILIKLFEACVETNECPENEIESKPFKISFLFLLNILRIFTSALTSGTYNVLDKGLVGPDFKHQLRITECLSANEVKINFKILSSHNQYISDKIYNVLEV